MSSAAGRAARKIAARPLVVSSRATDTCLFRGGEMADLAHVTNVRKGDTFSVNAFGVTLA